MSQDESVTLCFACIQPIKTYMKNIFLFILVGLFFVSCTRSVDTDTAKVVIQLPQFTLASLKSEALKSKVTAMNETIDVEDRSEDAFSDITPTGYTNNAGDVPINCYLVGIGGPEAFLNVNFAGLKNTQGILIPSVQFGPFVGIKPAGASIELSVAPGDNRTVFVFGFHSVDISLCQDIQTAGEKTSKSNFSKPYLIGKSDPLKFVGGQEITVSVNLQTIANSTKLDDFYFPSFGDKISRPPATHIAVENNSFPQNIIRTNNTFTCEPLDIVLRSGENSGAGILPYPVQASIIKNSSVSTIYTDYLRCLNNSADTTVAIPSGQSSVRVWARALSSDPSSADLSVAVTGLPTGSSLQSLTRSFQLFDEYQFKYEIIAPKATVKDKCVPVKVNYRKLFGYFPTGSLQYFNIEAGINGTSMAGLASFYENESYCDAGTPVVSGSSSILSGDSSRVLFMKVHSDQYSDIGLQVIHNSGASTLPDYTNVRINKESALLPVISDIRFKYKNYFKTGLCIPLEMSFYDQKGNYIPGPQVNSSRTIQIDFSDSNMSGVLLYRNSPDCSNTAITGSAVNVVTTNIYDQFYIISNTGYGPRSISLKLDTGVRQKIFFDVMDPSY